MLRRCLDCKKDISCRGNVAIRCEGCAKLQDSAIKKKWIKDNIEKAKKSYTLSNSKRKDLNKKWYQDNKERISKDNKKKYKDNRDYIIKRVREYAKNNPDKIRKQSTDYGKKRRARDPQFKLNGNLSHAVREHLRHKGISKNRRRWETLVGYTKQALMKHLENLFTDGMNWDNYGKWHIDHIIPKRFFKFNSTDDVEFKMCWRLENLQPLWALDNLKKSGKL